MFFWLSVVSVSPEDRENLENIGKVMRNIEEDVNAALHKFTLVTEGRMRPYGFIMQNALVDSLPKDPTEAEMVSQIRLDLQECISIYMNWRYEFLTDYPRSLQGLATPASRACNLFQAFIESEDDFKVVYFVASQLERRVEKRLSKGEPDTNTSGPWNLVEHLERNFICKKQDLVLKIKQKTLPATVYIECPLEPREDEENRPATRKTVDLPDKVIPYSA